VWNNARTLSRVASAGFLLASLLTAYEVLWRVAQLNVFAVREIRVVGDVGHVTREQVETVIFRELRGNFFTMDLGAARGAFEKLPWVRQVDVRRRWPDRIDFVIEEHRAIARWGSTALVNDHGEIFEGASNQTLPVFSGPDGTSEEVVQKYRSFAHALAAIGRHIDEVRLSPRRAWRVRLDDGTAIELGRDAVENRLAAFVAAYDRTVGQMQARTAYIDLRYANGFAVRIKGMKWGDKRA